MCWIWGSTKLSETDESLREKWVINTMYALVNTVGQQTYRITELMKNRGQKWYGTAFIDPESWKTKNKKVRHLKDTKDFLYSYDWEVMICHARYPTSGNKNLWERALQPFQFTEKDAKWGFSFAFNGNIPAWEDLQKELEDEGYEFNLEWLDTELIQNFIRREYDRGNNDLSKIVENLMGAVEGSCNIAIIDQNGDLIVSKDRYDLRPLSYAVVNDNFVFSSESTALEWIWARDIHFMKSWEVVEVRDGKIFQWKLRLETQSTPCVFEYIYFSSPQSEIHGTPVSRVRTDLGRQLAVEMEWKIDVENARIVEIPESSHFQTVWFSQWTGIKIVNWAIIKDDKVWRTFTAEETTREEKAKEKYIYHTDERIVEDLRDKDVYLVDDSVVRGTTSKVAIEQFRKKYNPRSVHMVVPAPSIHAPCFFGINMPTVDELEAPVHIEDYANPTQEELDSFARAIWADSITFLSLDWLTSVVEPVVWKIEQVRWKVKWMCMACLNGLSPISNLQRLYDDALKKAA